MFGVKEGCRMTTMSESHVEPLRVLRHLRSQQSWTLGAVAVASVVGGVALTRAGLRPGAFWTAFGTQCAVWGLIDLGFAAVGVGQSVKTARVQMTPQAEADEFLAAEKLLKILRFNHTLNVGYVLVGAVLLAAGLGGRSPALLGHGAGVLVQGGFLLAFDLAYATRYARLMTLPPE